MQGGYGDTDTLHWGATDTYVRALKEWVREVEDNTCIDPTTIQPNPAWK
jgi:hypothetical protein